EAPARQSILKNDHLSTLVGGLNPDVPSHHPGMYKIRVEKSVRSPSPRGPFFVQLSVFASSPTKKEADSLRDARLPPGPLLPGSLGDDPLAAEPAPTGALIGYARVS